MSTIPTRRKVKQLNVPAIEEDPAERKRILNVLAQRRYRKKKKEHLQNLERSSSSTKDSMYTIPEQRPPISPLFCVASPTENSTYEHMSGTLCVDKTTSPGAFPPQPESTIQDFFDTACLDPATLEAFDATFSFPLPSLPSSPSISNTTVSSKDHTSLTSRAQPVSDGNLGMDEVHLPMLELNLLRGAMAIARRVGVDSVIWSLDANSPFHNSTALTYSHLPSNLKPTIVQIRNAHHPVLDILPWPSVRNKLILVFSQEHDLRPPNARSPTALLDLIYDMEDAAEGIRIWGDDPYTDENWEIGQKLFCNWWWALNSHVVDRSNELRKNRGASVLGVDREVQEVD
ncbi:hypothetical protein PMZ80_008963 [Knufia obscura]|uniref:BZIP domain-containing protein n=2 Tax=Knufia TaxID=430999 RepID=A0AAN8EG96_9EURO|nr:hypothetical protein PMZ80_008963 [Knufia obscura]KAK5955079.1 hypothetical protein OHC33_003758 [Knufia fluminis]